MNAHIVTIAQYMSNNSTAVVFMQRLLGDYVIPSAVVLDSRGQPDSRSPVNRPQKCSNICLHSDWSSFRYDVKGMVVPSQNMQVKGRVSTDIGNMELWARGWSIYFLNLPFPWNPKENASIRCILSTPEQNLLWHIIGCTPNTFHNTINKNVNHSNDTIDNLNQSSFHKPACQCQGHLRTESLSASAHILHCAKIRPWVVRSGFRYASADLRQSRYLHVAR